MNRSTHTRWLRVNLAVLTLLLPVFMVGFQNCSPQKFDVTAADDGSGKALNCSAADPNCTPTVCPADNPDCNVANPTPTPCLTCAFDLIDMIVQTDPGVPKEFTANYTGDRKNYQLSFQTNGVLTLLTIPSVGTVEVINQSTWTLRFTPLPAFTGSKDISLHAIDGGTKLVDSARVTLSAGINTIIPIVQPALAVRASACVMCHANVKSNIITDFGYHGDGGSRDYYFGKNLPSDAVANKWRNAAVFGNENYNSFMQFGFQWNDGSVYGDDRTFWPGDALGNWGKLQLESGKKIYIPQGADIPSAPAALSGAHSLKEYLQQRFAISAYSSTQSATIAEYSNIFIGAPTADRLRSIFGATASTGLAPIAAPSVGLAGLSVVGSAVKNTGVLTCEGDVFVNGPVLLTNLHVNSRNGCRLYATGAVFVYGPIVYDNASTAGYANTNLQITSSRAIMMGLGELSSTTVVNGVGSSCEVGITRPTTVDTFFYLSHSSVGERNSFISGSQPDAAELADYDRSTWDSMYSRMTFWNAGSLSLRGDARDGFAINKDILADYAKVGTQKDAACGPEKRAVSYSRLLLNAPQVHSRYWGDFNGVIIAEFLLPALGQFHFRYDPVFLNVPILPKLQAADYLKVN